MIQGSFRSVRGFAVAWIVCASALSGATGHHDPGSAPLRVLLAGLSHGHVDHFLRRAEPAGLVLAALWEPDDRLREKYRDHPALIRVPRYADLDEAVRECDAEVVWAFSNTRDHLAIVRAAAPHRLSVIVEKPLAISLEAAMEMAKLSRAHGTLVLTNYETSWYPVFEEMGHMIGDDGPLGPLRQIFAFAGHPGPVKIGVKPEFLAWIRDPERAGGGALFDFGCYGANLATWWLENRAPEAVSAQIARFDPVDYPDCDDHAVIQMIYPDLQVTVVGSWHWPYGRKDAALYGESGSVVTIGDRLHAVRLGRGPAVQSAVEGEPRVPLRWYAEVVRSGRDPVHDPSSLANNLIVMEILEAARLSAAERRTVSLAEIRAAAAAR